MGNSGKVTRRGILRRALMGLFLAGWLIGCSAQPVDMSLLTGDPCAPPCWQYITPGVTGQTEALARLMRSPFVKRNALSGLYELNWEELGGHITHSAWESAAGPWDRYFRRAKNYIFFRNDTVLWMEVFLEFELTAGQAVEKYGPPEGVFYNMGPHGEKHISLYYPHQGLSLEI